MNLFHCLIMILIVINVFAEKSTKAETPAEDNTKRNASQIIDSIFKRYRTNLTLPKDKYGYSKTEYTGKVREKDMKFLAEVAEKKYFKNYEQFDNSLAEAFQAVNRSYHSIADPILHLERFTADFVFEYEKDLEKTAKKTYKKVVDLVSPLFQWMESGDKIETKAKELNKTEERNKIEIIRNFSKLHNFTLDESQNNTIYFA